VVLVAPGDHVEQDAFLRVVEVHDCAAVAAAQDAATGSQDESTLDLCLAAVALEAIFLKDGLDFFGEELGGLGGDAGLRVCGAGEEEQGNGNDGKQGKNGISWDSEADTTYRTITTYRSLETGVLVIVSGAGHCNHLREYVFYYDAVNVG
jgi:hypothetical protein